MSQELRERIYDLLSDISGELDKEDEVKIVESAYKKLSNSKKQNDENIIDAILAAFKDDIEDDLFFEDAQNDLYDLLRVSSYDENTIKKALYNFEKLASSEYDYRRGAEGAYYDEKGGDYRPPQKKKKGKMEEFEINDGVHDDIEYHNQATKTDKSHRTRADMLNR
jgi:hypothetical protein